MLILLRVKNFILIRDTELEFSSGLNVFTGETGVGKTILVNALKFLLGSSRIARNFLKEDSGEVEGIFQMENDRNTIEKMKKYGFSPGEIIIRRVHRPGSRERYYINDTLVTKATFDDICSSLMDIHSQNENQSLLLESNQLKLFDDFLGLDDDLSKYKKLYYEYIQERNELEILISKKESINKEFDFIKFQFDEIKRVSPLAGEYERLQQKLKILKGMEEYQGSMFSLRETLYEGDASILSKLDNAASLLSSLSQFKNSFKEHLEQIEEMKEKIASIYRETEYDLEGNEEDMSVDAVQERLSALENLRKYGQTMDDILKYFSELEEKLSLFDGSTLDIASKQKEMEKKAKDLRKSGSVLTQKRLKGKKRFEEHVSSELDTLAMKGSQFSLKIIPNSEDEPFSADGMEEICFMLDTIGRKPMELNLIASGGELSRIMLVLKSMNLNDDSTETLVFDEIDAGIGGETANAVGEKIKAISGGGKQVIAITHLHQIARFADTHFMVDKETDDSMATSTMKNLSHDERISEIARMLGGEESSMNVLKVARDLLGKKAK